jgi:hypothetical protein
MGGESPRQKYRRLPQMKDHDEYQKSLARLIRDLQADAAPDLD